MGCPVSTLRLYRCLVSTDACYTRFVEHYTTLPRGALLMTRFSRLGQGFSAFGEARQTTAATALDKTPLRRRVKPLSGGLRRHYRGC